MEATNPILQLGIAPAHVIARRKPKLRQNQDIGFADILNGEVRRNGNVIPAAERFAGQ
jgi:hypothetical protein